MCEQSGHCGTHAGSRADFHREHERRARLEAERLLAARARLGQQWLGWVAQELYAMSPAPFAAMVRRELQRLSDS